MRKLISRKDAKAQSGAIYFSKTIMSVQAHGQTKVCLTLGETMRKVFAALIMTVLMASMALADVLYLKNGSVLRGRFVGYENGKFIFETGGNRLEFRPDQVSRLVVGRDDDRPPRDPDKPPSSPGGRWESATPFEVRLEEQWYRSQIQVERGQRVRVEAGGTIYLEGRT